MGDQKKDHIDPERLPQRNHSKQLQTHNIPAHDMENTNGINKGDLLLIDKLRTVPRGTERMLQVDLRHRRATVHWSIHHQWEQDETKKFSSGVDRLQKGIWYDPAKLDNKLAQNVQDIRRSHKLHRENHGNLGSEIDNRRKKT